MGSGFDHEAGAGQGLGRGVVTDQVGGQERTVDALPEVRKDVQAARPEVAGMASPGPDAVAHAVARGGASGELSGARCAPG